jgi:hypothetical protein
MRTDTLFEVRPPQLHVTHLRTVEDLTEFYNEIIAGKLSVLEYWTASRYETFAKYGPNSLKMDDKGLSTEEVRSEYGNSFSYTTHYIAKVGDYVIQDARGKCQVSDSPFTETNIPERWKKNQAVMIYNEDSEAA